MVPKLQNSFRSSQLLLNKDLRLDERRRWHAFMKQDSALHRAPQARGVNSDTEMSSVSLHLTVLPLCYLSLVQVFQERSDVGGSNET